MKRFNLVVTVAYRILQLLKLMVMLGIVTSPEIIVILGIIFPVVKKLKQALTIYKVFQHIMKWLKEDDF